MNVDGESECFYVITGPYRNNVDGLPACTIILSMDG